MSTPDAQQSSEIVTTIQSEADTFDVLSVLGRGGMGAVYKAHQRGLNRIVAIKLIHPHLLTDPTIASRLKIEGKASAALDHPNIIRVFSMGSTSRHQPFLVMEYVEGMTLEQALKAGPLPLETFRQLFTQILSALECAHTNRFLHRDIKPANIFITAAGQAKLMDFGIVKILEPDKGANLQTVTRTGAHIGTPYYMSPEQCQGKKLDERSDLYSLGCVMFETITGKPPIAGENALEVMFKHLHGETPRISVPVSAALEALIYKAMAKNPSNRFQSAAEMREELAQAATAKVSSGSKHRDRKRKKAAKKITAGTVIVLAAIGCSLIAALWLAYQLMNHGADQHEATAMNPAQRELRSLASARTAAERIQNELQHITDVKLRAKKIAEALHDLQIGFQYGSGRQERFIESMQSVAKLPDEANQERTFETAEFFAEKFFGQDSEAYAETLLYHGLIEKTYGHFAKGRLMAEKAAQIYQRISPYPSANHAASIFHIGGCDTELGHLKLAEQELDAAVKEAIASRDIPKGTAVLTGCGEYYAKSLNRPDKARDCWKRAIVIFQLLGERGNEQALKKGQDWQKELDKLNAANPPK